MLNAGTNHRVPRTTLASSAFAALVVLLSAASADARQIRLAAAESTSTGSGSLAEVHDPGLIYGRITTTAGKKYVGRMRWDDEEASWVDYFNSVKVDNDRWVDEVPRRSRDRSRRGSFQIFGFEISRRTGWNFHENRQFIARFGDISRLEINGDEEITVVMKSGERYRVDGGSNDIGADITIWDDTVGEIDIRWSRIETIEFLPTPASVTGPRRLYGTVETRSGSFTGPIQWDQDEALAIDKLDGEDEDGDVAIQMGRIRTIERISRRASAVTLDNGETMDLEGTNDVDDDNRGIYVDDPRWGRVLIHWDAFRQVDFSHGPSPSYADFGTPRPLRGKVTDADGKVHNGRIVYDLDEAETWELLNGQKDDIEYGIPFSMIASIVPRSDDSSRVTLRNGTTIDLEGETDVGENNAGILIYAGDSDANPVYVAWDDVDRIDFD